MRMDLDQANGPLVAVGLLSGLCQFGSSAASIWVGTDELRSRRARLRRLATPNVALHFVIESPDAAVLPYMWRCKPAGAEALAREEAARHRDILFLNVSRDFFGCGWKYVLWFREALRRYPAARWIASGDDDVFIQFSHLDAELRFVGQQTAGAAERVYWGLILWRSYYNAATHEPSANFEGFSCTDAGARRTRRRLEACARDAARCVGLAPEIAAEAQAGQLDPSTPPFPLANGPLFALSAPLAAELASSELPPRWLADFRSTNPFVTSALAEGKRPNALYTGFRRQASKSCWPAGDVTLGWWLTKLSLAANRPLTLVESKLMQQHHPWQSMRHIDNRTILVHKLKSRGPAGVETWEEVRRRTAGPFEPWARSCGECGEMGWVAAAGSAMGGWRCCGERHPGRRRKRKEKG